MKSWGRYVLNLGLVWLVGGMGTVAGAKPADEPTEEPLEVGEVVVSATKTPLPVAQVTSAVEVIKGEDLEQRKFRTVVDALRLSQGTAVFSNGGPGTNATVRIRGANSAQTLVLIDGAIVNSPTSGDFNFANLTAENIDRIEILRGAQSMLYGSDAIGGVINIITKRGAGRPTGSAFVEYGSFATLREGGQLSGAKGPVDFAFSLSRWDTSNFSVANYRRGATERDAFHNWQGSGRLGFALPKEGRIDVTARWWNSDVMLDNVTTLAKFDVLGSKQTTNTLILSASYEQPLTTWWSQKLTVGQSNERLQFDPGSFRRNIETGAVNTISPRITSDIEILNRRIEWQHNFQVGKPLLLSAGYQYRDEQGDNPSFQPATSATKILSSHAGFAQAQVNLQERLLFTAGVRQDRYNTFGDATTYRITGGYRIPEMGTKFRGSYATGFRAPTINQLFFPGFGNPDLQPEESRGWDVGIDQSLWREKLFLSFTYYHNDFENLIQNAVVGGLFKPENVGEARTQGWEAGFKVEVLQNLSFRGQYTYTSNRNLTNGNRLARVPIDQAGLGLSYRPIPALQLHVDYRFVGARNNDANNAPAGKLGAFGVVSATATYDLNKTVQLFGRVENLGDQQYEEIIGYGTAIRSVFGGVKLTL
ncbi:MAG: TonB-dependent receptor plug domain-containing protein [Nitrospiraceae bacterium]